MDKVQKFITSHKTTIIVTTSVFLLVFCSISFFITNNIYNSERFAEKTTKAITSETARKAISKEIATELLEDQPLLVRNVVSEPVENLVTSSLGTELFSGVFYEISYGLNKFLTTKDFEPVKINISEITPTIETVVNTIKPDNDLNFDEVSSKEIVIFDTVDLPSFKTFGQALLIAGPVIVLILVLIALFTIKKLKKKVDFFKYAAIVLVSSGLILLVLTYTGGSLLTVTILDPERSLLMSEIYNSFISSFRNAQYLLVILGLASAGIYLYKTKDVKFSIKSKKQ